MSLSHSSTSMNNIADHLKKTKSVENLDDNQRRISALKSQSRSSLSKSSVRSSGSIEGSASSIGMHTSRETSNEGKRRSSSSSNIPAIFRHATQSSSLNSANNSSSLHHRIDRTKKVSHPALPELSSVNDTIAKKTHNTLIQKDMNSHMGSIDSVSCSPKLAGKRNTSLVSRAVTTTFTSSPAQSPKASPRTHLRSLSLQPKKKTYDSSASSDGEDGVLLSPASIKFSVLPNIAPRASTQTSNEPIKKKKSAKSKITNIPSTQLLEESPNDLFVDNMDDVDQDMMDLPNFDLDLDLSSPSRPKYNASPYQRYILSKVLPSEGGEMSDQTEFTLCKAYALVAAKFVDFKAINDTINLLISNFPILTSEFYRNPNIIDADVECLVKYNPAETLKSEKYVTQMEIEKSRVEETINHWRKTNISASKPFALLLLEFDKTKVMEYHRVLVFGASIALIDTISLNWIIDRFFQLLSKEGDESAQEIMLQSPEFEESVTFEFVTDKEHFEEVDFKFWKSQSVVLTQDDIEIGRQLKLERELRALDKETSNMKRMLLGAEEKYKLLTSKLASATKKRRDLNAELDSSSQLEIICDPVTLNPVYMTKASKVAILSSALNSAKAVENFREWLHDNGLSETILEKLKTVAGVDEFLLITDFHCDQLNLEKKSQTQLLAFVESCKNKVKEALEDVEKIKLSLEREISRLARAINAHAELITKAKNKIILNEEKSFGISAIINPVVVVKTIPALSSKSIEDVIEFNMDTTRKPWDTLRFSLRKEIIENLCRFSILEKPNNSIGTCALAAFGILLKHSTGQEQFLIGLESSVRPEGSLIGPLSDTLPVQFDLSSPDLTISELCNGLSSVQSALKAHSVCCPRSFFEGTYLPIQFQYYSKEDLKVLESLGTIREDLCQMDPVNEKRGRIEIRRVYKADSRENYNLRLAVIQKSEDEVECLFTYRKDKFERERMEKYAEKYSVTLESFNDSRRKVTIATVLARYHNPLYSQASFNAKLKASSSGSILRESRENITEKSAEYRK